MKAHSLQFLNVIITTLLAFPILAMAAAPASTSPYYTDTVQSYVQDQVSKDMEELNGYLCMIGAMAPDQLVNQGEYIAMVDTNKCKPHGQNQGTEANGNSNQSNFLAVELSSSRTSNSTPMFTKIWMDNLIDQNGTWDCSTYPCKPPTYKVPMYASASQAPSNSAPYGVFRLDYCRQYATDTNCTNHIGYIDASKSGLSFYTLDYKLNNLNQEYYDEFGLVLSANSSSKSGSGIVIKTNTNNSTGTPIPSAIVFAHNPDFFYRDDGINPPQCFDRSGIKSQESVYRYGLYDSTTGARVEHQSGFPFKYIDATNTSYYGYIGYYGYWLPYEANLISGDTIYQVSYNTYPPTETPYTLKKSGGRLTKYTTTILHLADINLEPFEFTPAADIYTIAASPSITPYTNNPVAMTAYKSYKIYWDKDYVWFDNWQSKNTTGAFIVQQQYNINSYKWEKVAFTAVHSGWFANATTNGFWGSAPSLGGSFNIPGSDIWNIWNYPPTYNPVNVRIISNTEDAVYPAEMADINTKGGLKCIGDCPTKNTIDIYNTYLSTNPSYPYSTSPFANPETYPSSPSDSFSTLVSYTLNTTSYNLKDSALQDVVQTQLNYIGQSGKMVKASDMTDITAAKVAALTCTSGCSYTQANIDILAGLADSSNGGQIRTSYSYYKWFTSSYSWDQMAFLNNGTTILTFYPAIPVSFKIPNSTKYGDNANTTSLLYYGDFGNLWGIPYKCIDLRNNNDCIYAHWISGTTYSYDQIAYPEITPYDKQYYSAEYSIPFDITSGVVTAAITQGNIIKGTQFLVKSLDKELRLNRVPIGVCEVQGLGQNISVGSLPSSTKWNDPSVIIGPKPVLTPIPAPRVIDGVKQY